MMQVVGGVLLMVSGIILVPGGVLLTLRARIERQPLSERAARRLLHGLLMTIVLLMSAMYALQRLDGVNDWIYLIGAPTMITFIAIACLHLYGTPALRNGRTATALLIYSAAIVLLITWKFQISKRYNVEYDLIVVLVMIGAGLTIALIWQTVQRTSRWLWLMLGLLIAAIGIFDFAYNGTLLTWPVWMWWLLDIVSVFLIPVVLITLSGRVTLYLAEAPRPIRWRTALAGMIAAMLLIGLLIVRIVDMFLLDGFADWGIIGLPVFFGVLVFCVALMLIWTLKRRRVVIALAYLGVMAVVVTGFFTLTFSINDNPQIDTVARAEQVDQAIRSYYADNGEYPSDLYSLAPRYLLVIPNPVLFDDHVWCYEGGADYYRLAYVYRPVWGAPSNAFSIRVYDSAGNFTETGTCEAQLADYRERYGVPG